MIFDIKQVKVITEEWTLKKDVENFQRLDIGVYPLSNDERAIAKTGFKTPDRIYIIKHPFR